MRLPLGIEGSELLSWLYRADVINILKELETQSQRQSLTESGQTACEPNRGLRTTEDTLKAFLAIVIEAKCSESVLW